MKADQKIYHCKVIFKIKRDGIHGDRSRIRGIKGFQGIINVDHEIEKHQNDIKNEIETELKRLSPKVEVKGGDPVEITKEEYEDTFNEIGKPFK